MRVTWLLRLNSSGAAIGGRSLLLLRAVKHAPRRGAAFAPAAALVSSTKKQKQKQNSPRRLRQSTKSTRSTGRTRKTSTAALSVVDFYPSTSIAPDVAALSLAEFHPAIARTWIAAASNKMLQPQHVSPGSRKLAWWICPSCEHQFNKRIDLHLAAGGACPKCHAKPSLSPAPASKSSANLRGASATRASKTNTAAPAPDASAAAGGAVAVIAHRCRPQSSQTTLAADNANMLSKSVADDQYLRVQETRNLLPMLAKNFENEKAKIGADEVVRVSPKLDGIRCVVAYRADTQQVLFFSRSGTLFECCDDLIEPAVRHLFEEDPTLVLDGELYNDSVNLAQLAALPIPQSICTSSNSNGGTEGLSADPTTAFYTTLLSAANMKAGLAPKGAGKKAGARAKRASVKGIGEAEAESVAPPVVIRFEQLTSAIRTTRQRLTPAVAALQRQLQYHVFDVLYARAFPGGSAATVPFSARYAFLEDLLAKATAYNTRHIPHYNPLVLRRVPNFTCTVDAVDVVLRAAMQVGYEGVMIRREGKANQNSKSASAKSAKAKVKLAATTATAAAAAAATTTTGVSAKDSSGGYGYGQRSSTLLKYKVMQDAEYVIVGAVEGSGKWKGSLGSFICVTADQSQQFTVTPASTDAEKKRMWRTWKQAYKGKALTVQYQELTPDGVPRFPVGKCVRGAADGHDWL